ncbi:recombinase family protein [Hungatella hathewayi]
MRKKKRAWLYGYIDAPEDIHGELKKQYDILYRYAQQLGTEVAGHSNDLGCKVLWERNGFKKVVKAIRNGDVNMLVVVNTAVLSRSQAQLAILEKWLKPFEIEIYSPSNGRERLHIR